MKFQIFNKYSSKAKILLNIYRDEVEVDIQQYLLSLRWISIYSFSIIFKGECEKLEENFAKHEKKMLLSLAITPKNPINISRAVIIMQNSYIHLWKLY